MKTSSDVERWFVERKHPLERPMRRVCEIILRADPRMSEYIKYGTVVFGYEGDFATFVQMGKKHITLMFNRGARIPGRFPHLDGTHPSARFMRFKDLPEVEARTAELGALVAAWCLLMESGGIKPAKTKRASGAKSRREPSPKPKA